MRGKYKNNSNKIRNAGYHWMSVDEIRYYELYVNKKEYTPMEIVTLKKMNKWKRKDIHIHGKSTPLYYVYVKKNYNTNAAYNAYANNHNNSILTRGNIINNKGI